MTTTTPRPTNINAHVAGSGTVSAATRRTSVDSLIANDSV
jgi:hypothetical protein